MASKRRSKTSEELIIEQHKRLPDAWPPASYWGLPKKPIKVTASRTHETALGESKNRAYVPRVETEAASKTMPIATDYRNSSRAVASRTQPIPVDEAGWPVEKWMTSPEKGSRKQGAIAEFLLRVWKPFIEETGAPVSRKILEKVDPQAASALRGYLTYAPFPKGLPIYTSAELKEKLAERPLISKTLHFSA